MIDQAEIRKRRWIAALTLKRFWIPTLLGSIMGLIASQPIAAVGWAAAGLGIASAIWQLTFGSERLTRQVMSSLRKRSHREHAAYLRQLQRKLRRDRDPRTGDMLRKLREIYRRMESLVADSSEQASWQMEVLGQVRGLYESSLSALERSFELWAQSQGMSTDDARQQVLDWRDGVLKEVEGSIQQLAKSVDQFQALALQRELPDKELTRMRSELEQGLAVARNVEQRIHSLEHELSGEGRPLRDPS